MNERLRFIVSGFFVGIAELLPGVSGSTIALAFNVYDKFILFLSNLRLSNLTWDIKKLKSMIDVNLIGALHTLDVILPVFMKKNSGHLVFTGSLVGYRGLPGALGYGSSKAALVNLGETLRYDLKDTAIKVQLINPGFVKTRLTDKNKFKMLQIMSPEVAAGKMFSNMNKNSFSSSFPAPFSWLFRVSQLLPDSIYFKLF